MKRIKCFERGEAAAYPGKYVIRPIHENFHLDSTEGSFNVICARLMGLTYPEYLRMCRDCFGAEIIGKGSMYPVEEHAEFVKEKTPRFYAEVTGNAYNGRNS